MAAQVPGPRAGGGAASRSEPQRRVGTYLQAVVRRLAPPAHRSGMLLVLGAATTLAALVWLTAIHLLRPQWPFGHDLAPVAAGTVVVLALTACITLVGELLPRIYGPGRGRVVVWSVPFGMAVLAYAGLVPALVLSVAGHLVLCVGTTRRLAMPLINLGGSLLCVTTMWTVLTLLGWDADPSRPWALDRLVDVPLLLAAVVLGELASATVYLFQVRFWNGDPYRDLVKGSIAFYLRGGGLHQLAMVPAIVVVMVHAPLLTVLMILTVTAVHRAEVDQERSTHAAEHDGLTGLANRRSFVARTRRALAAATHDRPVALLVLDLDGFKRVNDELGHPAGDRVLLEVAARLRAGSRQGELVGRIGGDEFAVLLTDLGDAAGAAAAARRLQAEVQGPCRVGDRTVDVGVSVGTAVAAGHGADFDSLYARADAAMFTAKRDRGGRGRHLTAPRASGARGG